MNKSPSRLQKIISEASFLLDCGLEPKSAIKQAANDNGVPYGDEMGEVVDWVLREWGIGDPAPARIVLEVCPEPTVKCACKGDYCRLLGRNLKASDAA